jgi:ferric-dicitrate binding protein FerR (iron transport regulator)
MNEEELIAYLCNALSAADCQKVEAWYLASEDNQKLLEQMYFTLFVSDRAHAFNEVDVDKSFAELKDKIKRSTNKRKPRSKYLRYDRRIALAAAAVFIGVVLLQGVKIIEMYSQPFTIVTALGERAQTILPDGSKVWVGACSKLEYYMPLVFAKERKVYLTGEAYFEVEKDTKHPFIVNSNSLQIAVTGTRFNIRSNEDDPFITTTLLEGSIRVTAAGWEEGQAIIMKPQEQLRIHQKNDQSELFICPIAEEYIEWINGRLHFEQASLKEIAASLERYYNVDITIAGEKLQNEKFTCDFETTENIYQIFSILKLTNKFDYKINNRQIELSEIRDRR